MDRFVDLGRTRGGAQSRNANNVSPAAKKKMAATEEKEKEKDTPAKDGRNTAPAASLPSSPEKEGEDYERLALAVAHILKPMIKEAVAEAMQVTTGMLKEEMKAQAARIGKIEERLMIAEKEVQEQKIKTQILESALQTAWEKIDNIENRSRRNNLRLVGIPDQ